MAVVIPNRTGSATGGAITNMSFQAWGAFPGSPSTNDIVYINNVPYSAFFDGTNWKPGYDPLSLDYLINDGVVDLLNRPYEIGDLLTFPATDADENTAGDTITTVGGTLHNVTDGDNVHRIHGWDLSGVASTALFMTATIQGGSSPALHWGFNKDDTTTIGGALGNDGYFFYHSGTVSIIYRRTGGADVQLVSTNDRQYDINDHDPKTFGFYWRASDGTLRAYQKVAGAWQFVLGTTDTNHVSMKSAYVQLNTVISNLYTISSPFIWGD